MYLYMVTDKEILDTIHTNIHALRLIKSYKPSPFEIKLNQQIAQYYAATCKECADRINGNHQAPNTEQGFMGKLGQWANGAWKNAQEIE